MKISTQREPHEPVKGQLSGKTKLFSQSGRQTVIRQQTGLPVLFPFHKIDIDSAHPLSSPAAAFFPSDVWIQSHHTVTAYHFSSVILSTLHPPTTALI